MEAGQIIGRYQLTEPLGAGGMGQVWKALDRDSKQTVVVKSIATPWTAKREAERLRGRLRREAKILLGLKHDGVVGAIESFEHDAERFLVLEHVEGQTLSRWLRQLPPPPLAARLSVSQQLAQVLVYTHGLGVIHRDLKPSNLMLSPQNRIKVLDFGLARDLDATRLTKTGFILGTLRYMAPEVGRMEEADERADIYALGILTAGVLGLRRPFRAMSQREFYRWLTSEQPVELDEWLPADLKPGLAQLLAKDRSRRTQTAAEALVYIDSLVDEGDALDARLKRARHECERQAGVTGS